MGSIELDSRRSSSSSIHRHSPTGGPGVPGPINIEEIPYPTRRNSRYPPAAGRQNDDGGGAASTPAPSSAAAVPSPAHSSTSSNHSLEIPPIHSAGQSRRVLLAMSRSSVDESVSSTNSGGSKRTSPKNGVDVPRSSSRRGGAGASALGRGGLQRRVSTRKLSSSTVSASVKTSELFAEPLVSEGEGSVFPLDMPLSERRTLEVNFLQKFDRIAINPNVGDFWLLIDAIWMGRWVDYVMGNARPPGPISNYNLYDHSKQLSPALLVKHAASAPAVSGVLASRPDLSIKKGLVRVKDYRAVHPLVWFILREIYDTDESPEVCRWKPDLYSDEVKAPRKFRLIEASHTRAVYELRRFVAKIKEDAQQEKTKK